MKASIDANGCLVVDPETSLESFALRAWVSQWQERRGAVFRINVVLEATDDRRETVIEPDFPHLKD